MRRRQGTEATRPRLRVAVIIQGPWDGKNASLNKVECCRRAQREGGAAKRSMLPAAAAGDVADEPAHGAQQSLSHSEVLDDMHP